MNKLYPLGDSIGFLELLSYERVKPFNNLEFKFHIRCPVILVSTWLTHGILCGDIKMREVGKKFLFYFPEYWVRSNDGEHVITSEYYNNRMLELSLTVADIYRMAMVDNMDSAQAAMFLPQSVYVRFTFDISENDLMNLMWDIASGNLIREMELYLHSAARLISEIPDIEEEVSLMFGEKFKDGIDNALQVC